MDGFKQWLVQASQNTKMISKRKMWCIAGGGWAALLLSTSLLIAFNSSRTSNLNNLPDAKSQEFASRTNYRGTAIADLTRSAQNVCSLAKSVNVDIEEFASIQTNSQLRDSFIAVDAEQKEWDKASAELLSFYPDIAVYSPEAKDILLSVEIICPAS